VPQGETEAQALLRGDRVAAARLAGKLLLPLNDNFVERPWGSLGMHEFKRVQSSTAARIGEAFEICADEGDDEARRYPSTLRFDDGSTLTLSALLAQHAETLLGASFVANHGKRWPLLPKTLAVAELLSVQAHPPGNTEVYVIIAAARGATIRLGFKRDVDPAAFQAHAANGRRLQERLLALCRPALDAEALQTVMKTWLADRAAQPAALEPRLRPALGDRWDEGATVLRALHDLYWEVLDLMNEIPVTPGQVIYNATPAHVAAARGTERSAEVHALGNTSGREILALEIRKPGPTFRAWDNVRFPLREVDTAAALAALNLQRTEPGDFVVPRLAVEGRPGVTTSVSSSDYRLEHLEPTILTAVAVPASGPHCLHVLAGAVTLYATDGAVVGRLARGDSALVPIGVGAYRVVAEAEPVMVVKAEPAARAR
jgi:mannose-6-phosphate isomerase class I